MKKLAWRSLQSQSVQLGNNKQLGKTHRMSVRGKYTMRDRQTNRISWQQKILLQKDFVHSMCSSSTFYTTKRHWHKYHEPIHELWHWLTYIIPISSISQKHLCPNSFYNSLILPADSSLIFFNQLSSVDTALGFFNQLSLSTLAHVELITQHYIFFLIDNLIHWCLHASLPSPDIGVWMHVINVRVHVMCV